MTLVDEIRWEIPGWRLKELEQDSRDLKKAQALIARLRAENKALKEERRTIEAKIDDYKRECISKRAYQRAGAAIILKAKLLDF